MTARNPITGDLISTKQPTDAYRDNWEAIFGKPAVKTYAGGKPNYVQPEEVPAREWVGLTEDEVKDTLQAVGLDTWFSYRHAARAIEAKLKEKNS